VEQTRGGQRYDDPQRAAEQPYAGQRRRPRHSRDGATGVPQAYAGTGETTVPDSEWQVYDRRRPGTEPPPQPDPVAGLKALGAPQQYDDLWAGDQRAGTAIAGPRGATQDHENRWAAPQAAPQTAPGQQTGWSPPSQRAEPKAAGKGTKRALIAAAAVLVLILLAGVAQWLRPLPAPRLELSIPTRHTFAGTMPTLPMPAKGQVAIDVAGLGTMASSGTPTPTPTASVAKVMTAYLFLKDHPLAANVSGPTFTIGAAEAARLQWRIRRGESHVNVTAGEPFTEQEALQALIIVSANNIAHEVARWDAGNEAAFVQKMNTTAQALGMTGTTYTDPSGYESSTVSTAADQVKLLEAVMQFPAFAQIAAMKSYDKTGDTEAVRPSTNALLGVDGVVAGKTGFTDAAGGNFVFAARKTVHGVSVLIIGAVMAQTGVTSSAPTVAATRPLIEAAEADLTASTVAAQGSVVGHVNDGLGTRSPVVAAAPVTVVGWPGLTVTLGLSGTGTLPHTAQAGQRLDAITLGQAGAPTVPVMTGSGIGEPSIVGRLLRLG
jgi:D-alanyl-D-alanine carboxypeptidase